MNRIRKFLGTLTAANVIAIIALAGAIVFNAFQIKAQNQTLKSEERIASAQYVLQLSDKVDSAKYTKINRAIENGNQYTLITSTGANPQFSYNDLEDYMGNFETLGDLVNEGVIDPQMAYQEFSYDVTKTWCNRDVQKKVQKDRSTDPNSMGQGTFWNGFQSVAMFDMKVDHATSCDYYDNQ